MSAAADAPPPPPPPPPSPPKGSFDSLPAELLLEIIQYLYNDEYLQFALAIYEVFQHHGLLPPLTDDIYNRITRPRGISCRAVACGKEACNHGGGNRYMKDHKRPQPFLPLELYDQIMDHLSPTDRLSWLLSDEVLLDLYCPELSLETRRQLRELLRNVRKKTGRKDAS